MSNDLKNHFGDRLNSAIQAKKTPLVVGIDPRFNQLPPQLINTRDSLNIEKQCELTAKYCCDIIDVVAPLVPAVKPQAAFFEQLGWHGMVVLSRVVDYARQKGLLTIMDAKRGDIGSTAAAYAKAYLGPKPESSWGCDSLTVNPYLGADSLEPFVDTANATGSGLFVLVKTSNPGSDTLQEKIADGKKIYAVVADHVQSLSRNSAGELGYGNIGAVVGATYPEQLAELRASMPNTIFLIPGFGAQGGTAKDVAGGLDENGLGGVINSSRAIIFAYSREQYSAAPTWQAAVEQATRDTIAQLADGTTAGKLR
ncbi:MAG: orotidine-5'-phosphate decarboxylase [Mariniblastus sp.]